MQNILKYLPALLILVLLYMIWKINKAMTLQTSLLINMAGKMGIQKEDSKSPLSDSDYSEESEPTDISDEEEREYYETKDEEEEGNLNEEEIKVTKSKGKNKRLNSSEREELIIGFFENGIPKNLTTLAYLLAGTTGNKPSIGNASTYLSRMVENNKLAFYKSKKVYGLPEWFDNKKLKKEFIKKIK